MRMRLLGVLILLVTDWQRHVSAIEDPEKFCPCLPPRLCPRIFGLSPVDSKQIGRLPDCKDLSTVRCCGASLTVITEHQGTTKYDEDYVRLGKSPVYIPAKIQPVPIPENVMRKVQEMPTDKDSKLVDENTDPELKNRVTVSDSSLKSVESIDHKHVDDVVSLIKKTSTIEKSLTNNDITTSNPIAETSLVASDRKCEDCDRTTDISSSLAPEDLITTEKYSQINSTLIEHSSFESKVEDPINETDRNLSKMDCSIVDEIESTTSTISLSENINTGAASNLSDESDSESPTYITEKTLNGDNTTNPDSISPNGKVTRESISVVNAQPYNVKTMRKLEMPQEVYIILPNEETGRMMYMDNKNGTENTNGLINVDQDVVNEGEQSNEINDADDQIQNATNRQEVVEKHLESIVFQNWENRTEGQATEKTLSTDEDYSTTAKPETTTKTKRSRSQQIRHNLYTRKPNSSILLQSRNKVNGVTSSTPVSVTTTTTTTTTTKKDESVIRREEIERISNLTRDQLASGSENVPVVVRKPPSLKSKARTESRVEENVSEMPPNRVPHFRHPPRMLKPVTSTRQPFVDKSKMSKENEEEKVSVGDDVEEGEETNNDEVIYEEEEEKLVPSRSKSRRRQHVIARNRGGSLFQEPAHVEDTSVDTSEEERMAAMHEFRKIRGQNKFKSLEVQRNQNKESILSSRDVTERQKTSTNSQKKEQQSSPRTRLHSRTRPNAFTLPDFTTVLPKTTTSLDFPTVVVKTDEENSSITEGSLLFQNDDSQDESPKVPSSFKFGTEIKDQVQPVGPFEGRRVDPVAVNQEQEVYTGRRLVSKKNNFEHLKNSTKFNTEEITIAPEVYTGRKLVTTTLKPGLDSNSKVNSAFDNLKSGKDRAEEKPSITDEINNKETRQQNSGLNLRSRHRSRKNPPLVAAKTPQPIGNVDVASEVKSEAGTTPEPLLQTSSDEKFNKTSFRGNFLRSRNRLGVIEMMIRDQMIMAQAALRNRMLRNVADSGKIEGELFRNQHNVGDHRISNVGSKGLSDSQDLVSEGTEDRKENKKVPKGFRPPARMERGFSPIVVQENKLNVVGPLPTGFHDQHSRYLSDFTEDGVPVQQLELPLELSPPRSFANVQSFQENKKESGADQKIHQSTAVIEKRTLTELVPPVIEAIFFRTRYDDVLKEYNEALMKYNEYIIRYLENRPIDFVKEEKNVGGSEISAPNTQ